MRLLVHLLDLPTYFCNCLHGDQVAVVWASDTTLQMIIFVLRTFIDLHPCKELHLLCCVCSV
jgi:hypothetical protein